MLRVKLPLSVPSTEVTSAAFMENCTADKVSGKGPGSTSPPNPAGTVGVTAAPEMIESTAYKAFDRLCSSFYILQSFACTLKVWLGLAENV
jgi:hypothetical protein